MDLTKVGYLKAWRILEAQNRKYLGISFTRVTTAMEIQSDYYFSILPKAIQTWVEKHMDEHTELWKSVQAVAVDMDEVVEEFKKSEEYKTLPHGYRKDLQKYMAWAWHLLYQEQ